MAACSTIAVLSQRGRLPLVEYFGFWQADKLAHALAYGVVGALALVALGTDTAGRSVLAAAWAPWLLTVVYGISDEVHQSFVPGRCASGVDLVADAVGAAIGIALLMGARRRLARRLAPSDSS